MPELFNPKIEEKILEFWKREQIFEKSLKLRQPASAKATAGKGKFVFYEGPPSANGQPGLHHVLSRVYKDIICRYKAMCGFLVSRKAGWDTHGLPIELQVEKELGLRSKKDIEKYGVGNFNEKAQEIVWRYKEEWDKLTERIGFWLDLKDPYITYKPHYIESVWCAISQIAKKKLLYQDFKVVPYCSRCGTALSSHEVALGYEKVSENSVYLRFKVKTKEKDWANTSIFSWTTTPWTLPGNVALAINPNEEYVCVSDPEEKGHWLVLGRNNFNILIENGFFPKEYKNLSKSNIDYFKGKEMLGIEYEPLFDIPKLRSKTSYKIYPADFVTLEEGTGVVHIAPMYGEDDFNLGKKVGLPKVHTVDLGGRFIKGIGLGLDGVYVKSDKAESIILDYLKNKNLLFRTVKYEHDYPFCWRCHSPLLYYAKSSWFIRMEKLKKKLLDNNKKINWVPSHIKYGRFGGWLNEIKDWAFSRERYWGTPLPVWQCLKCKNEHVVGSLDELDKFAVKKLKKGEHNWPCNDKGELDLHRPYVDSLIIKCQKCSGKMMRVKDVIDVWFDSGAMPFAQYHWPFNKKLEYPADFISEGVDQTRGWFYTLHAVGTLMERGPAFKNVICLGHILDEKGEKMSKSKGNVIDPWEVISKYGIDALRWYFFTINPPGESKRFAIRDVGERLRRFILTLSNVLIFYKTYSSVAKSDFKNPRSRTSMGLLDKWILSRLNQTIKVVRNNLDKYEVTQAARPIDDFIDDLSRWWLRRSRKRFSDENRGNASAVLKIVLEELSKLIAPFTPFLAEYIWQELNNKSSVHLADYPKPQIKLIDKKLEEQMNFAREIASKGLTLRAEAGIKVRQPLSKLQITNYKSQAKSKTQIPNELLKLIKEEVNVKEIIFGDEIKLDTEITEELKAEGILRELARQIQELRRDGDLTPKDSISVFVKIDDEGLKETIKHFQKILAGFVNAKKVEFVGTVKDGLLVDRHFEIENKDIWIGIVKIH